MRSIRFKGVTSTS